VPPSAGGSDGRTPAKDVDLRASWERTDHHRLWTGFAVAGVAVATGMALVGLPDVDLHGPLHRFGIMDPLCGGTRSARFTMRGEWGNAWQYNPLGFLAVLAAAAVSARAWFGWVSGRWLTVRLHVSPRARAVATAALVLAVIALEIRQQGRADMLMRPY
jgi:hypothetical protein